jgi:hypothetical protein
MQATMLAGAITALLTAPSHPQPAMICDQPLAKNITDMYEHISRLSGARVEQSRNPHIDVIWLEAQGQMWNFTKATHPAYPAIACIRIVKVGDQRHFETQLRCNAAKPLCDKLYADYLALQKEMTEAAKRHVPKQ